MLEELTEYLSATGWRKTKQIEGYLSIWRLGDRSVFVPADESAPDFRDAILKILWTLAEVAIARHHEWQGWRPNAESDRSLWRQIDRTVDFKLSWDMNREGKSDGRSPRKHQKPPRKSEGLE